MGYGSGAGVTTAQVTAAVPTAAAISTQVWSDKEVISAKTYNFDTFSKTSGIVQNTKFTVFDLTDCSVTILRVLQDNTENDAKEVTFTFTIDGDTWETTNVSLTDNVVTCLVSAMPATLQTESEVTSGYEGAGQPFSTVMIEASTTVYAYLPAYAQSFKLEVDFDDAPGTAQTFKADVLYYKDEVT